jgi:type II secretory pathway pseudopilin PulG
MKRAGIIIGIVLIGIAYVLGFWPQYQKVQKSRQQLEMVNIQLAGLQAQVGLYRLQHDLLAVTRQTNQKNYGQASALSTKFFDAVRDELPRQIDPKVKTALQSILQQRDAVTSALAKGDPGAPGLLQPLEDTMFQVLSEPIATPVPPSSPN